MGKKYQLNSELSFKLFSDIQVNASIFPLRIIAKKLSQWTVLEVSANVWYDNQEMSPSASPSQRNIEMVFPAG